MSRSNDFNAPIDAVITWVDGSDPVHRKKMMKAQNKLSSEEGNPLATGQDPTRFLDNEELYYSILSIRKFAPWTRVIHLVTDNQKPDFLTEQFRKKFNINLVDHTEIFSSHTWALPTFNSRTIETAIWKIPGLAPRFIYLNDDFVITQPVDRDDFFTGNSVVLRGNWQKITDYNRVRLYLNRMVSKFAKKVLGITRSMHLLYQIKGAELAGMEKKYFRSPHVPHPVKTETLAKFFGANPETFSENIKYPFRDINQFSVFALANHLELQNDSALLKTANDVLMINGEMDFAFILKRKIQRIKNREVQFVCLQGLERLSKKRRAELNDILNRLLTPFTDSEYTHSPTLETDQS